jgi:hypothetical protein
MSDEFDHLQVNRQHEANVPRQTEFQEVPGEAEADSVRDAFLKNAGQHPADVASALSGADSATKARAVNRLQQERGNAYIQRVVAESRGTPGRLVGRSQPEMVDEVLQRKGSGNPLPDDTRGQMEGFFGADMSGVRVHTDGEAATLNRELNAQAFTVGSDVFFAEGKYNPSSSEGQGLLAHELTHVGQQGGFGRQGVQRQAEEEEQPAAGAEPAAAPAPQEEEEAPAG